MIAPSTVLPSPSSREAGVVFTKDWTVDIILDLAGYTSNRRLADCVALEPSAGDGAFLRGMTRRLVDSCRIHRIPIAQTADAIRAYEIDEASVADARENVRVALSDLGVDTSTASFLASHWVRHEDFLEASLGFPVADFVIGNPPYIRLEDIPPEKAEAYRRTYHTMRGRADIYIAFNQAALTQLKPGGVCAFICADRWLLNDYGKALRTFITSGFNVRYIVETHDVDAFETEVSAYPAITVISNDRQGPVVVAKANPGIETADRAETVEALLHARSNQVVQSGLFSEWFTGGEPWPCSSPESLVMLKRLEAEFPPLENHLTGTKVGIGVATGADDVFVVDQQPDVEAGRLLPLALGADLQDGKVAWSGHYLVNPWEHNGLIDLGAYPKTAAYLGAHKSRLSARNTAQKNPEKWHKTIDRVNFDLLPASKLYIADIRDRLRPSLDTGKTYPHHNVYWITSKDWDLRVLGALLMSEVGEFFVRCYGVRMRGGYYRFQAQYLRRIRVPLPRDIPASIARQLAAAFDEYDPARATTLALQLYGISRLP